MATLLEYFKKDFPSGSIDKTLDVTITPFEENKKESGKENLKVLQSIRIHINSSARLFTYYIPNTSDTLGVISHLLGNLNSAIKSADELIMIDGFQGDVKVGKHQHVYSKRIFFYTEEQLSAEELKRLDSYCNDNGMYVTLRSKEYLKTKMEIEKPIAFISHDSRDKDLIAREMAEGLSHRCCYVWYDEYSLKVGDSLRESIEKGIKEAKKCILILTKNYLSNPGWSKNEFNSIFTKEMIMNEKIILPVWYGVTKEEICDYCLSLGDRFALIWPSKEGKSETEYKQEVEKLISKLHTAISH